MEGYVETSRVSLRLVSKLIARKFIEKNHYSGRLSSCRYSIGIFYQFDNEHKFFNEKEEKLIGCIAYGYPIGRRVLGSIFKNDLELTTKKNIRLTAFIKNIVLNPMIFSKSPISEGISPLSSLRFNPKYCKFVRFPISGGISPESPQVEPLLQ